MSGNRWEGYYHYLGENGCYSFSHHLSEYQRAVKQFFPGNDKLKILVGGVAGARSSDSFYRSWNLIRPENQDSVVFLDQNLTPLAESNQSWQKVQAKLEEMPFKSASFDLILLDFTLDFLNDRQLKNFFAEAKEVLSPSGKIIAIVSSPFWRFFENLRKRIAFGVPYFSRESRSYCQSASSYFVTYFGESYKEGWEKDVCLLVFEKQVNQETA